MAFQNADTLSLSLFVVFGILMMALVSWAIKKSHPSPFYLIGYFVFIGVTSALALSGIFRSHMIPVLPIFILSAFAMAIFYARSNLGKGMAQRFSFSVLIAFQAFRFPLELILHHWAETKVIPTTMTWTGQNWDIIAGLLALVIAPLAHRRRSLIWFFEIVASLLLLNVLRVVIFSLPLPFSWSLEIPLQLPFEFPYVLILPLFVWPAILGHLILLRKLRTAL